MNSIHASARSATPAARPPVSAARNTRSVSGQLGEVRNTNDQRSRADADSNWRRPPPRASDAGIDGNRGAHWRQPAALPARQEQQGPRVLEPRLRAYRNGRTGPQNVLKVATTLLRNTKNPDEAMRLFRQLDAELQTEGLRPNEHHFNALILKFTQAKDMVGAMQVVAWMRERRPPVAPTLVNFNTLMGGFAADGDQEGIDAVRHEMQAQDPPILPDRTTASTMMSAYAMAGNGKRAEDLLDELLLQAGRDPSLRPDGDLWHLVIKAYSYGDDAPGCVRVIRKMHAQVPPVRPELPHYGQAMHACSYAGDAERALALIRDMDAQDPPVRLDRAICEKAMKAHVHCADGAGAKRLLRAFQRRAQHGRSPRPDEELWGLALRALGRAGQGREAVNLLHAMPHQTPPLIAGVDHYNTVLFALAETGDWSTATTLFREMEHAGAGARPDRDSYKALMLAHAKAEDWESLEALFEEVSKRARRDRNLQPDLTMWNLVLEGSAKRGDVAKTLQRHARMQAPGTGVVPNLVTFNLVALAHANNAEVDAAVQLLEDLEAPGSPIRPNAFTHNTVILAHANKRDPRGAEAQLRRMSASGSDPDIVSYHTVLRACADVGDGRAADRILAEIWNPESPVYPDQVACRLVMQAHARSGEPGGAIALLKRMQQPESPIKPDVETYDTLIPLLRNAGRFAEALRLVEDAIATGVYAPDAGYDARSNTLDFHARAIVGSSQPDPGTLGVASGVALTLLDYHRSLENIDASTRFIVGKGGAGAIRDAVLDAQERQDCPYIVAPDNPGMLVPRRHQPVASHQSMGGVVA